MTPQELRLIDDYWRAANYLSVGQIYLCDSTLLRQPLAPGDVKRMLLGHWGKTPVQNFIYAHLNCAIQTYQQDLIHICGSGHGGYNCAGVEHVMGFCWKEEHEELMHSVPPFEKMLVNLGVKLLKQYLNIDKDGRVSRLAERRRDPLKQWKTSPIDAVAVEHWRAYFGGARRGAAAATSFSGCTKPARRTSSSSPTQTSRSSSHPTASSRSAGRADLHQ